MSVSTAPSALVEATHRAAGALSEMACREISVGEVSVRQVPLSQITEVGGDPERAIVAIHIGVEGFGSHLLLAMGEPMARGLVDMLMGQSVGTTEELGEMEASALAEVGNVAGTYFLTAIADATGATLPPTPPVVFYEMSGAILGTLAAELAMSGVDDALVIDTNFFCDGQAVEVAFYMFPDEAMLEALPGALAGVGA
ncbi:MAG: chemotaxis protein CheC [Chloroflexota bacterium]